MGPHQEPADRHPRRAPFLVQCLATPETTGRVLEIGGPEATTYNSSFT